MKNERQYLPLLGVGPIYGGVIIGCTVAGIALAASGRLESGHFPALRLPFLTAGAALILLGIFFWFSAVFRARVDDHIMNNSLATDGVYAWVRNPIYSALLMACTGAILIANNLWLLILPVLYWAFLTVLMKHTEEKWLYELHGEAYAAYVRSVNRCIPWFPKKG